MGSELQCTNRDEETSRMYAIFNLCYAEISRLQLMTGLHTTQPFETWLDLAGLVTFVLLDTNAMPDFSNMTDATHATSAMVLLVQEVQENAATCVTMTCAAHALNQSEPQFELRLQTLPHHWPCCRRCPCKFLKYHPHRHPFRASVIFGRLHHVSRVMRDKCSSDRQVV